MGCLRLTLTRVVFEYKIICIVLGKFYRLTLTRVVFEFSSTTPVTFNMMWLTLTRVVFEFLLLAGVLWLLFD